MPLSVRQLWDEAENAIELANEMNIAGYSCPLTDVEAEALFRRSLKRNAGLQQLTIVNPDPTTGAVLLGAGSAGSEDVLTIIGAVVLAVSLIAGGGVKHMQIDYPVYARLHSLDSKDDGSGD